MKKFILALLFFSYQICFSQSGWFWLNPLPQGHVINSTRFLNPQTGFAVGNCGTITKTTNAGQTWDVLNGFAYVDFGQVFPVDDNYCYVIGTHNTYPYTGSIIKTTNGGINWSYLIYDSTKSLNTIFFKNINTGFIGGNGGSFSVTTNGGLNWLYKPASTQYNFHQIYFSDDSTGFAITGNNFSSGSILRTTNQGNSWNLQMGNTGGFYSMAFINANSGFVIGGNYFGCLYATSNAGTNWVLKDSIPGFSINGILFADNITGYLWGATPDSVGFYKTINSGNNWFRAGTYPGSNPISVWFADANSGYAVQSYSYNTDRTTNGGANWIMAPQPVNFFPSLVSFANDYTGFISYGNESVLKTTDGGIQWNSIRIDTPFNISSIYFLDANTGYAAGARSINPYYPYPEIFKTTNSGLNWMQYNVDEIFLTLCFVNNNIAYAASMYSIYKTTNSGVNWTPQIYLPYAPIKIYFIDSLNGYVGGSYGASYKTTNGGINWINLNFPGDIYDFYFFNTDTGYAMSNSTYIKKTTNGGLNWTTKNLYPASLHSLYFTSEQNGFAVGTMDGYQGAYYRTTDGGQNWFNAYYLTCNTMQKIFFTSTNTGYIFGDWNTIFKTTNGGNPIGITQISNEIPLKYNLYQNYPNPFNPTCIIKFSLPNENEVHIKVYDLLGREVKVLMNEFKKAGNYEVTFDGTNLASGIYFYRIEAGTFSQSKKMVLIK